MPKVAVEGRFCDECGRLFHPKEAKNRFCRAECRKAHHGRRMLGGMRLYDLAMEWRRNRRGAWRELSALADQLAGEERLIRKRREERIATIKAKEAG